VPEARFLGVTMSDIKEFDFLEKLTIKAKEVDVCPPLVRYTQKIKSN
jgi:DNA topoisomerase VI subunit A